MNIDEIKVISKYVRLKNGYRKKKSSRQMFISLTPEKLKYLTMNWIIKRNVADINIRM